MKKIILSMVCTFSMITSLSADSCFDAEGKAFKDAQTIRKIAISMGWKVGKSTSITVGTFIKGKKALYPQDKIKVCLKEDYENKLVFKAQSLSSDAGNAEWRPLFGNKK